ncbi:MAG TPA: GNAT family N-acetyltransferase, partial [Stackebrandtia sp.]|uniref:GNAT family N-acetyltransferase n=1 Tax=Stackebrandtia sp. TaxID=2023065 RepID=UPI002D4FFDDE
MTNNPYPLRPVTDAEFPRWARMIADTYGIDRTDAELAIQRSATDLSRTVGAFDGATPVGGASIYPRRLTVPGARLDVAGVASVAVPPTHRRRGINTAMMRYQLEDMRSHGEAVAALRPAEAGIYGRYGYGPASQGAQWRADARAMVLRGDTDFGDGAISLLDAEGARGVIAAVYERVARETVGWPDRDASAWDLRLFEPPRGDRTAIRYAAHTSNGRADGYVLYRRMSRGAEILELAAETRAAHASLWRFMIDMDLVDLIEYEAAVDDPLLHLLVDPRATRPSVQDRLWVRLVDVDVALAARRYAADLDVVIDVADPLCPWNNGR